MVSTTAFDAVSLSSSLSGSAKIGELKSSLVEVYHVWVIGVARILVCIELLCKQVLW